MGVPPPSSAVLVLADIEIERVERTRETLEDRFLALTSTTGGTP